jgi:hypothetical protein
MPCYISRPVSYNTFHAKPFFSCVPSKKLHRKRPFNSGYKHILIA